MANQWTDVLLTIIEWIGKWAESDLPELTISAIYKMSMYALAELQILLQAYIEFFQG
jgi:hypothetical protein